MDFEYDGIMKEKSVSCGSHKACERVTSNENLFHCLYTYHVCEQQNVKRKRLKTRLRPPKAAIFSPNIFSHKRFLQ